MSILFTEFELLSKSELFDSAYYLATNPDIAALNVDPLMHYLEWGCQERRDPSAGFDTAHYLSQCTYLPELPRNPVAHYLTEGMDRGLTPVPLDATKEAPNGARKALARISERGPRTLEHLLYLDVPRIAGGRCVAPPSGSLAIVGWAVADTGIASIDVLVDGHRVTSARHGIRRPDVAAAHPERVGSMLSGYAAHLPAKALLPGEHSIAIVLRCKQGAERKVEFLVDVEAPDDAPGPWQLRRKAPYAEYLAKKRLLDSSNCHPEFQICLHIGGPDWVDRARHTLRSLKQQAYPRWLVNIVASPSAGRSLGTTLPPPLAANLEELVPRLRIGAPGPAESPTIDTLQWHIAAGDEFSCDALTEMALAYARHPSAAVFYCDDRRPTPHEGKTDAFFKPGWSPDLLLSTNYVGRAWCATAEIMARIQIDAVSAKPEYTYDVLLKLTEGCGRIIHVPKLLFAHGNWTQTEANSVAALKSALRRRKITGEVMKGAFRGHYRTRRKLRDEKVSIIIPTCAANDHIRTCLQSLRGITQYRNYEIVCIENIPKSRRGVKRWLAAEADLVLHAGEPFNWSRFNNRAARRAGGSLLLFLNDDIEIIDPEWLGAMVEQAQRTEVGVVGARLLYPDRSVQHAGMVLDHENRGLHAFRNLSEHDGGYFGLSLVQRNVIGVTGACLLTRREVFENLGRFDEAHAIVNNDLDYCLRSWRAGFLNVYTPHARAIHHELASRGSVTEQFDQEKFDSEWHSLATSGDPYFNPNLSREHEVLSIEREPIQHIYAGRPIADFHGIRKILVVKLDHIGDCITALPAVRRLKAIFPHCTLTVLAGKSSQLVWKSEPCVDAVLEFGFFHARSGQGKIDVSSEQQSELAARLNAMEFDLAVDLRMQPDARQVLQWSGARVLAGFDHQGRFPWLDIALEWDEDVPLRNKRMHVADELRLLVETIATQISQERIQDTPTPSMAISLPAKDLRFLGAVPYICVHPSAGNVMRQWSLQRFARLIVALLGNHRVNCVLIGGPDDQQMIDELEKLVGNRRRVLNMGGRIDLTQLNSVLSGAALFVGNNSGPQHIAAALGVPTIGIHSGVVDAREWAPSGLQAIAIKRDMACSPCYLEKPGDCSRSLACLNRVHIADVYAACTLLLHGLQSAAHDVSLAAATAAQMLSQSSNSKSLARLPGASRSTNP